MIEANKAASVIHEIKTLHRKWRIYALSWQIIYILLGITSSACALVVIVDGRVKTYRKWS
jgi:hypothetical protein